MERPLVAMADDPGQSLFRQSERFLSGHGRRRVKDELAALAAAAEPELMPDAYGSGALLEELEADVAARLGKPAAVFLPSGTMADRAAHPRRAAGDTHVRLSSDVSFGAA